MKAVAKELGITNRTLYRRFPFHCRQISSKYNEYRQAERQRELMQLENDIFKAVDALKKDGIYPSRRKVNALLSRPTSLVKSKGATIWRRAVAA